MPEISVDAPQDVKPVVIGCPRCGGRGMRMKTFLDEGWKPRTFIDASDFVKCETCQGSGLVFVVPALVIGPAPKKEAL